MQYLLSEKRIFWQNILRFCRFILSITAPRLGLSRLSATDHNNHQPNHISLTVATRPTEQFTVKWYCEHSPTQSRISSPLVGMWAINITSAGQSCLSATDTITINQTINQSISAWLSRPRPTEQFTVRWYCEHSPIQSRISSPLVGMWAIKSRPSISPQPDSRAWVPVHSVSHIQASHHILPVWSVCFTICRINSYCLICRIKSYFST